MTIEFSAVPLHRYCERVGYRETAFFGLRHPDNDRWECRQIWTESQRAMVAWALMEAQEEIETEIGYPLVPRWLAGERHTWRSILTTRWSEVIAGGIMADTMAEAGVTVDYSADPATVLAAVGTCAASDLRVFLPGTDIEVVPTVISVTVGVATITIPWPRLVAESYRDNPSEGWDYNDMAIWGTPIVDVRCIANDPGVQATLVARHGCTLSCSLAGCADYQENACIYVRDSRLGSVSVERANYVSGAWARACPTRRPQWAILNYQAGLTILPRQAEDTVIRLAHSKMPEEPCGCDVTQRLWRRDRNVPEVVTRERINCPFGTSDGAWTAWRFVQTMKRVRGNVL